MQKWKSLAEGSHLLTRFPCQMIVRFIITVKFTCHRIYEPVTPIWLGAQE